MTIIVLATEQDVGKVRGAGRAFLLDRMSGTVIRWFSDLTDGETAAHLVAERLTPARYQAVCEAAGVQPAVGHVLVLVKRQSGFLRGLIRRKIVALLQERAPDGLKSLPVDLVLQLQDFDTYAEIQAAMEVEEPEPEPPAEPEPPVDPESAAVTEPEPDTPPADEPLRLTLWHSLLGLLSGPYAELLRLLQGRSRP